MAGRRSRMGASKSSLLENVLAPSKSPPAFFSRASGFWFRPPRENSRQIETVLDCSKWRATVLDEDSLHGGEALEERCQQVQLARG